MEVRLVILLALVFISLVLNTAFMVYIWSSLKRASDQMNRRGAGIERSLTVMRDGAEALERASAQAREWSAAARERTHEVDADLERAEDWCRYGLAKVDFKVDRASEKLHEVTDQVCEKVRDPLYQTSTFIQGLKFLLELIDRGKRTERRDLAS